MGYYTKTMRPQPPKTSADQLQKCGPLIEIIIQPPRVTGSSLAVRGLGIFDTGAARGMIDYSVVTQLKLMPLGPKHASHGIGGSIESEVYDVYVDFPGPLGVRVDANWQAGHDLASTPFPIPPELSGPLIMVIGRDIMQYLSLVFDGPRGLYSVRTSDGT
jgi:hypothetical protein